MWLWQPIPFALDAGPPPPPPPTIPTPVTTTYETILAAFEAALLGRLPTRMAGFRFHLYDGEEPDFATWCDAVGEAAFRCIDIMHGWDTVTLDPFDLVTYRVQHSLVVRVGYPLVSVRYGAGSDALGDDLLESDLFDLNAAIGQPAVAGTAWPLDLNDARLVDHTVEEYAESRLLRLTFRLDYWRATP